MNTDFSKQKNFLLGLVVVLEKIKADNAAKRARLDDSQQFKIKQTPWPV